MKDFFEHRKNKVYVNIISVQGMRQSRLMWEMSVFLKKQHTKISLRINVLNVNYTCKYVSSSVGSD